MGSGASVTAEPPVREAPPVATPGRWRGPATALAFLLPALVFLGVWIVYPAIRTTIRSFFNDDNHPKFVGLHSEVRPMLFSLALREEQNRISALEVRTKGEPSTISQALQREIRRVNPRLLLSIRTMQDLMDRSIAQERMVAATSGFFGVLALVLSAIGAFGVASFTVARRTNEFGLRIALGAGRWDVIRESLEETVLVFGMGLIVGGALAFVGARLAESMISGLLFGLTATDWTNIAGTGLVLCAVALAACTIPAIRATRIDPVEAIRYE